MAQHLFGKKNKGAEPTGVSPGKPSLMHDRRTDNMHTNPPNGCNPLSAVFTNALLDKHISRVHRTWKNVCRALPKHGFLCAEEVIEPEPETSSEGKCCHQGMLEVLPPFERHILLCMSTKRPLLKEHMSSCNCADSVWLHVGGEISDVLCASSVGIFLQASAKDGVNLAHKLTDGKWTRRPLHTLAFARLQGEPGMIYANTYQSDSDSNEILDPQIYKESHESPIAILRRMSMKVFKERTEQAVPQQQMEYPDKEMLDSVQDFFLYTESEGKQVFEELDRDADGTLTVDDVKLAMRKMKLPATYAKDFMQSKHGLWPKKSFRWSEFSSMVQEKEPLIIQLFNSLGVSKSGTVSRMHVKGLLEKAGLSATETNVSAMMRFLAADTGDYIKYGQFRRFMLLLPTEQLSSNPWGVWLKAATTRGMEPSSENFQDSVLKYITTFPWMGAKQERFEREAIPC